MVILKHVIIENQKMNGKMCNEKWGKPECNNWIKDNIKLLEDSKKQTVLEKLSFK